MKKYKAGKAARRKRAGWLVLSSILIVTTVLATVLLQKVPKEETIEISPQVLQPKPKDPQPTTVESRLLLTGETFWGRRIAQRSAANELKTAYPFAKLSGFEKEKYDAWLTHLECPVSSKIITYEQQVNELIFNCEPSYLQEYAKWFDIVSLANNHTDNVDGEAGLLETRENLEAAGITHYGHYDNSIIDQICEVVPIPVRVALDDRSVQEKNLPIAMCGFHNVFRLPTEEELDEVAKYSEHFITITSPQMGEEYIPEADNLKTDAYRAMVDRGADIVAASHPHWVQNTEVYKGKLIMYSLGNFMFDQEWSPDVQKGVALDASFTLNYDDNIAKLLDMSEQCTGFLDNCLQTAKEQGITKPDFQVDYELVVSEFAISQTFPASETARQEMLVRTNWEQTMGQLAQ